MCKGLMEIIRPEIEKEKLDAIEKAKPQIIEQAEQKKCLEIARQLKECLDIQTISQKLGLPLEVVQNL